MSTIGQTRLRRSTIRTSRPSSAPSHRCAPPESGDLAVVEAELHQDLARVLAELRRAAADRAAAPAVGPDRELGVAALGRRALDELRMFRGFARSHGEI